MNEEGHSKAHEQDEYRSLLVLDEISKNDKVTQRELSRSLGVALGLVNSYIKNLIGKGYVTISTIPRNRYKYYLTPKGFTEKTRLTYTHLKNFTNLYSVARRDFRDLFKRFASTDVKRIAFLGLDEVAEIAYLSLQEVKIELDAVVVDNGDKGKDFFGTKVIGISDAREGDFDLIVVTSFKEGKELKEKLINSGFDEEKICDISSSGWLDKIK
ncbi:MAG: winged helix-turn-helix transcriptional regulator [Deltaproteobacteria bacterium]|nr:winged helix-turn-helix transcriptional regulator [Deltaproteobacteria bacterium]